jgi:hypothetical protein
MTVPGFGDRPAMAVLPFRYRGSDAASQEPLVDGVTEEVIHALSRWRYFPVIARGSVFAFKGKEADPRSVGQALGARYVLEVVSPQMTKPDVLALRPGGQGVADLHIGIRDDHPVDEEHHELAALLEAGLGQASLHAFSERFQRCREVGELAPALRIIAQLLLLPGQRLHAPLQLAPPPLVLFERDDRPEIGVGEPLELLVQVRRAAAQRLAAGEQLLRQPRPAVRPCHGRRQRLRLAQQGAEVPPHQLVELTDRRLARGAAGRMTRVGALPLAG